MMFFEFVRTNSMLAITLIQLKPYCP